MKNLKSRSFVLAMGWALLALASCTLAPDHCLTMSDCDDGTTCKEGLCVSNGNSDITQTVTEAGSNSTSPADASPSTTSSLTADAAVDADASDPADGSDDAMTDAPSDG